MGRSSYPSVFDSDIELPRVENNITEIGGEAINSLRDAIFSIERAIGLSPQGNMSSLVTRINNVIDANGNIKAVALANSGLVTLPIYDNHVSENASIAETKLDLDYSTTSLYAGISSNSVDIGAIRTTISVLASRTVDHFVGDDDRHDGYQIDLISSVRGRNDVESAINEINNAYTSHELSISNSHAAYGISSQNEFQNFSADNVQDALLQLDNLSTNMSQDHQDTLHTNGIAFNRRGEQGSQGNISNTTLSGTIYQTDTSKSTNIFQVMRPNVARVSSKNMDLRALSAGSAQYLRVQAGGIDRGPLDVNLAGIIPTDDLDQVVYAINISAQGYEEHYPISAYNVFGKLVIAHNIPGKEFTIQILDTVQFSAATVLGFGDVTSTTFEWSGNAHAGYVGGQRIVDLKPLVKKRHSHATEPLNTIVLGIGDLSAYGISPDSEGRVLCNITNHSTTSTDNGTHYILGYVNDAVFVLSADISLGEFDIEIVGDSVNFQNSAKGELYDIFVEHDGDGYGIVTKSNRVTYGPISGVNLKSISEDFSTDDADWEVIDASSIVLHQNDRTGVSVDIPTGYQGQLKVYAPDNKNSALFDVTGIPSSSRKSITIHDFSGANDKLHIASVHYSGNLGLAALKYAVDHRKIGTTVENYSDDELNPIGLEKTTKELRNNGVVRGLDIVDQDIGSFRVRGGRAMVDGKIVDVETQDIVVDDFSASRRYLLLNRHGNFFIRSEFDAGFSFSELTDGDSYGDNQGVAIICEFETDGSRIDGYFTDRRLMVNKIDKKLLDVETSLSQQITEIRNTVSGSSWGFTVTEASGGWDGYLASIEMGSNNGFTYIADYSETPHSIRGFGGGNALITTRRFEFSEPDTIVTSVFRAIGLTHINIFVEAVYTGIEEGINGPFGVSGTVNIDVGVAAERGEGHTTEEYATVKTINTGVLPVKSQTENYVVSIPVTKLFLPENILFDMVPRVRVVNSNYVDGGTGADHEPTIRFDNIRIITSSYSVAGSINGEDGSSSSISATVGNIL